MVIKTKPIPKHVEIDLTGPEGNAYVLLGYARRWSDQLGLDGDAIIKEMQSGSYENLVTVFDREFGHFCVLWR